MERAHALGPYTALRRIDRGGGAEIWKAIRHGPDGFQKILALKKLPAAVSSDATFIEETSLVANFVHPNVVHVLDFETLGGECYLAMEYVPGCDLGRLRDECVARGVRLTTDEALHLVLEVVRGLRAAHERTALAAENGAGVLHLGLTPEQVLLSWNADVKVGDFSSLRSLGAESRADSFGERLAWMSPEQAGAAKLDERSDLFSAALILYELVAGVRLFRAATTEELLWRVLSWEGITDEDLAPVPVELHELFAIALAPIPDYRFENAREFEERLAGLLSPEQVSAARLSLVARLAKFFEAQRAEEIREAGGALFAWDEAEHDDVIPRYSSEPFADRVELETDAQKLEITTPSSPAFEVTTPGSPASPPTPAPASAPPRAGRRRPFLLASLCLSLGGFAASLPRPVHHAPAATPTPTPLVAGFLAPRVVPVSTAAPPRVSAPPRAPATSLAVVSKPSVEVWLDDKRIAKGTPVRAFAVAPGRHRVRFVNSTIGFVRETTFDVRRNEKRTLVVDPWAGIVEER